ncbi:3-keto-5-aminohexanoate cleavage enzyme [Labrys miyagiensis]|uniref:3-keto-5-aminohexanoate cleavage enzyme n=1 Tax=Labrys miyagiensis TaxID=346912 RepID=A0ABQ6CSR9_9HYPH|nr:3-keto-5-aminohexanoate cleavage protein [Labrys miyagiensis]GLS23426.1 3-keto-5-aminohexanoate cleavage enzyme [Labrys miyagiensis]
MLQACLNGNRKRGFHPAIACTPAELATDARAAIEAGAEELHVHPRGHDGEQSLEPHDVGNALLAIRESVPGVPVGISTLWDITPGGRARQAPIREWRVLPDYVSINLIEEDAPEIMALMIRRGIGIEAGLWSVADALRFVALPSAERCLRILVEINEQDIEAGLHVARDILAVIRNAGLDLPILLHGADRTMWPIHEEALKRGLDRRIGLEDGVTLPDGKLAADNAELLRMAVSLAGQA